MNAIEKAITKIEAFNDVLQDTGGEFEERHHAYLYEAIQYLRELQVVKQNAPAVLGLDGWIADPNGLGYSMVDFGEHNNESYTMECYGKWRQKFLTATNPQSMSVEKIDGLEKTLDVLHDLFTPLGGYHRSGSDQDLLNWVFEHRQPLLQLRERMKAPQPVSGAALEALERLYRIVLRDLKSSRKYNDAATCDVFDRAYKNDYETIKQALAQGVREWLPIESAPKDGTPVTIFQDRKHYTQTYVANWQIDAAYEGGGHWFIDDGKNEHPLRGPCPTAWQPLPAAPVAAKEGE